MSAKRNYHYFQHETTDISQRVNGTNGSLLSTITNRWVAEKLLITISWKHHEMNSNNVFYSKFRIYPNLFNLSFLILCPRSIHINGPKTNAVAIHSHDILHCLISCTFNIAVGFSHAFAVPKVINSEVKFLVLQIFSRSQHILHPIVRDKPVIYDITAQHPSWSGTQQSGPLYCIY